VYPGAFANATALKIRNNSGTSASSTLQFDGSSGGITVPGEIDLNGRNSAVVSIENLAGTNTLSGDLVINVGGGNYWIQSDSGLLTLAGGVSSAATGTRTLTFQGSGDLAISGVVGNGNSTNNVVKSGAGTLTLLANNTYVGGTTVNGGTLILAKGGGTGTIRNNLTINAGATVNLTATDALGYTNAAGYSFVTNISIVGGTLNNGVNGNNGFNTKFNLTGGTMTSTGGGAYNFDGATGAGVNSAASSTISTISAPVDLRSPGVVFSTALGSVSGGIDLSVSGAINNANSSGTGSLIKSGAGTLSLSGVNTYFGATTISAGTLLIGGAGQLGSGTYAASITNNGSLNYGSSAAQTLSGVISGSGALTQNGPGTLTLSGANTYSGATTINGGVLALGVGGSIPNSPSISVGSGATLNVSAAGFTVGGTQTLKGNGMILGGLTVNGTLSPGTGIGVLTASNNVTLGAGSTSIFEISKAPLTNDQFRVSGALTLGGVLMVTNLGGSLTAGDSFTLFQAGSFSGSFTSYSLPPLNGGLVWNTSALTNGILSVIPAIAANPTNVSAVVSGGTLTLSWPADHLGWYAQSNPVEMMNPASWYDIAGSQSVTNLDISISPAQPQVFFRLRHP
jgi:autotransporter-associated beta strand protein